MCSQADASGKCGREVFLIAGHDSEEKPIGHCSGITSTIAKWKPFLTHPCPPPPVGWCLISQDAAAREGCRAQKRWWQPGVTSPTTGVRYHRNINNIFVDIWNKSYQRACCSSLSWKIIAFSDNSALMWNQRPLLTTPILTKDNNSPIKYIEQKKSSHQSYLMSYQIFSQYYVLHNDL